MKNKKKNFNLFGEDYGFIATRIIISIIIIGLATWLIWLANVPVNINVGLSIFIYGLYLATLVWCILFIFQKKPITTNYSGLYLENYAKKPFIVFAIIVGVILLILIVGGIIGSSMISTDIRRNQIGEFEEKDYSTQEALSDNEQIPIVKPAYFITATKDRMNDTGENYGNYFETGKAQYQYVNDELLLIAPLKYSRRRLWKRNGKAGSPGYFRMNANDLNSAQLVTEVNGVPLDMKYIPGGGYNKYKLIRYIRMNGYLFQKLDDLDVELTDDGYPYTVVTLYKNLTVFNTPEVTGVLEIDAITGEMTEYDKDSIPEYMDRAFTEEVFLNKVNQFGNLIHGFKPLDKKDKFKTTNKGDLGDYTNTGTMYRNGRCYLYIDITSKSDKDTSSLGLFTMDTRTGEIVKYNNSGVNSDKVFEKLQAVITPKQELQENGVPLIFNIEEEATYFMTLDDTSTSKPKFYGFCNISDGGIVGVGESIDKALANYINAFNEANKDKSINDTSIKKYEMTGIIERFSYYPKLDQYIFTLNESNKVFSIGNNTYNELTALTKEGEEVFIIYTSKENSSKCEVYLFVNNTLLSKVELTSEEKTKLEENIEELRK